ncbi:alpha/beta hydrolase [Streptomyces synnematoformans]|uniref:Alpha/beta hydrolase n=1 Tax=Streptomyces synnematoformans TaxID=415721 RepID=A0ABP5J342_9ACTN
MTSSDVMKVHPDLEYAVAAGQPLLLDLYVPGDSDAAPVCIWLHGGAWLVGDRVTEVERLAQGMVERGIAFASLDYRLGPAGAFPASINDVRAAVRWLRQHGDEYSLATDRMAAWGASAGGHLALMAALATEEKAEDWLSAVIACFAPTDLPARLSRTPLERQILRDPPDIAYLATDPAAPDLTKARQASPLYQRLDHAPPVLLVHGDRDQQMALDQSERMHQALVAAGRDSTLLVLGGVGHEDPRFRDPWLLDVVAAFVHRHLSGEL